MKKIWKTSAILINTILLALIALCSVMFMVTKPEVQPQNIFLLMAYTLAPAMLWFSVFAFGGTQISNFTNIRLSRRAKMIFRVLAGVVFTLMFLSPVIFSIPVHFFKVLVSLMLVVAVMAPMAMGVFGFLYGLSWAQTKPGEKNFEDDPFAGDISSASKSSSQVDKSSLPGNYHQALSKDKATHK